MSSSELKTAARRALKDNFLQKMLLLIIPLFLSIFQIVGPKYKVTYQYFADKTNIDFVNNPDAFSNVDWGLVLAVLLPIFAITLAISFLFTFVITAFQTAGVFNYIEIFRGEKEEINLSKDIVRTFHDGSFWKIALLTFVTQLIFFILIFIPIIGWGFAIYLGLSWSQSTYVLYDKLKNDEYVGIWDVLSTSNNLMKGYKFKYFLFNLTFIGWFILGALFYGLPQIWTMPFIEMSMVTFYEARIQDRL